MRKLDLNDLDSIMSAWTHLSSAQDHDRAFRQKELELIDTDIKQMIVDNREEMPLFDSERTVRLQILREIKHLSKLLATNNATSSDPNADHGSESDKNI